MCTFLIPRISIAAVFVIAIVCIATPHHTFADFSSSSISGLKLWLDASHEATTDGTATATDGASVQVWKDRSGNNSHATQLTAENKPTYETDVLNGKPVIRFDGGDSLVTESFLDSSFDTSLTFFTVAKKSTTALRMTSSNQGTRWYSGRSSPLIYNTSQLSDTQIQLAGVVTHPVVEVFRYNGSTKTLQYRVPSIASSTSESATGNLGLSGTLTVGDQSGGSFGYNGDIAEILIYNRALTDLEIETIGDYLTEKYFDISDSTKPQIIFEGDSLTYGVGSTGGNDYPSQVMDTLGESDFDSTNVAVSGQTTASMELDAIVQVDWLLGEERDHNILVLWGGTNDLHAAADATTTYDRIVTYATNRRNAGYTVVVNTLLPRDNSEDAFEEYRQSVNQRIRDNWEDFADRLSDIASDSRIGDEADIANATYYSDSVHMTNAGYAIVAEYVTRQIQSILDEEAPDRSDGSPSGELARGTTETTLSLETDEDALCKYGTTAGTAFASIASSFSATGTVHSVALSGLENGGSYSYYIRCEDEVGNINTDDYTISFSVQASEEVRRRSGGGGGGGSGSSTRKKDTPTTPLTIPGVSPSPNTYLFTRDLTLYAVGPDVLALQRYLNRNGFLIAASGPGSLGQETSYFGLLTRLALIRFQNAHAATILYPSGLTQGTGYFGPSTRMFINSR